jgi:peptide/nickel transport system permease protein
MLRYTTKRLLLSVVTLFIVSVVTFSATHILPGSAAQLLLGMNASEAKVEALRQQMGLNRPLYIQYLDWVTDLVTLDLGQSIFYGESVADLLVQRFPRSLYLALASMAIAIVTAIPLGIVAAVKRNTSIDLAISSFVFAGLSVPSFFRGLLFILIFAVYLDLVPPSGYVNPFNDFVGFLGIIVLPAMAIAWGFLAQITRMLRSSMLETENENFITTARAKGVPNPTIVLQHNLRNALLPTLTVMAFQIGYVFSGLVVIEEVFAYPGIGRLAFNAIIQRDLPVVQATVMVITGVFVASNLAVDLLYSYLDPRIRYGSGAE